MSTVISKETILKMMHNYKDMASDESWEVILEIFATQIAVVSGKLSAVQITGLVMIGASIVKKSQID